MNYFKGIIPEERWKNEVLNEMRKTNQLLEKLLERDAQTPKQTEEVKEKRQYRKRSVS